MDIGKRRAEKNGKLTSGELDRIRLEVLLQSLQRADLSRLREIREMMRKVDGFVHRLLVLPKILLFLERHVCFEVVCCVLVLDLESSLRESYDQPKGRNSG